MIFLLNSLLKNLKYLITNEFFQKKLLAVIGLLLLRDPGFAYVNVQTSTSIGFYRDYQKNNQFPLYHSWTMNGLYEKGIESSAAFNLNNNFSQNEWQLMPTQLQVNIPIKTRNQNENFSDSQIKLGRQLYSEGFDFSILDGIALPYYIKSNQGVMPVIGYLRSPDFEQNSDLASPIMGLIYWDSFSGFLFRSGLVVRDEKFKNRFVHVSGQYELENWLFRPLIYVKNEFKADTLAFNQNLSEILLHLTESLDSRISYSNLDPRPTNSIDQKNYVYRLFSVSPTETVAADFNWTPNDKFSTSASIEQGYFDSLYQKEYSNKEDLAFDYALISGKWLSPSFTHLKSYGGEIFDLGLHLRFEKIL